MSYDQLASEEVIVKTLEALNQNGMNAFLVENGAEAKEKVLEMIPEGSDVMTMTSVTNDAIGLNSEINEGGKYNSLRDKLYAMDRATQGREMQVLGAAPEWSTASAHAITQDGAVMIASATGSQLPAAAYAAAHVVLVVSTQKIVKDFDHGMKRIYDHVLPLESERAHKAYGVPGSAVNKLLIINKEVVPGRVTIILVNEKLGY